MSKTALRAITQGLFEKARDRMSKEELKELSDLASDEAQTVADNLQIVVDGIGCLVAADKNAGNFQSDSDVPCLMFSIGRQLELVSSLIHLHLEADFRLASLSNPQQS